MNIILIGFMCTGKDAVGIRLAQKLGMKFINTDDMIVKKEKKSIPSIFAEHGEKYFRDVESGVLDTLSGQSNTVVSTGGGIVLMNENTEKLKNLGKVILLKASPEVINSRIYNIEDRPLLNIVDELERILKITQLLDNRSMMYTNASDVEIDTSDMSIDQVVENIIEAIK